VDLKPLSLASFCLLAAADRAPSPVELDHIWIVVSPGAPERAALERAGLRIAPGVNRHEGQGTASVTVEFANFFLELMWRDTGVAVSPGLEPVAERFRRRAAWRTSWWSPFGIGLRRAAGAPDSLPFPTRPVRATWMPPGTALEMLTAPSDSQEPSIWVVPQVMAAARDSSGRRVTGARILTPGTAPVPALRLLDSLGVVRVSAGQAWLLELTFDHGRRGVAADLRPELPVLIHY
jgi:hypothetical protein